MPDVGRKAPTGKTHTQSMRFDNEKWSKADSEEWVKEHDGFTDGYEETDNEHRWRQYDPDDDKFRYRRFDDDLPDGVYFIVGYPKTKSNKGNNMNRIELRGVIVSSAFDVDWMQDFIKKGLFTPESAFRRWLGEAKTDEMLTVYDNSPGGSVFAGNEIINAVRDWKTETGQNVEVIVGALAASMASIFVIATATTVKVHKNSLMMFHGVTTCMCGGEEALKDEAELVGKMNSGIKKALLDKYKMDPATVADWFAEGRMGWLNAEEMLQAGIAQEIITDDADVILFDDSALATVTDHGLDIAALLNFKPEAKGGAADPPPPPLPDKGTLDYQRGLVDGAAVGRSEVTAEYADKVVDLNKKLQYSEASASKLQGEKDRTRTELDTLRTETTKTTTDLREQLNQTTGRLHKAVGGALKFSSTPDTWEAAVAEHKGDYAKAKAQYPELLDKYKQTKGGFVTVKNLLGILGISAALVVAVAATAGSLFTDITSHYPADIVRQANAMGDALEDSIDGTTPMVSPVVQGTLTAISTNGANTNVVITTDGELDGQYIGASTLSTDVITQSYSNDTGYVYCSNFAVKAGGTFTVPDDSVDVADINAGSLPTDVIAQSYSNDTGYVYCSNFTVKAGGTFTVPDDSVDVADISAGSLPTDVIAQSYSNDNGYVYCSNFTVKAGGTFTVPDDSVDVGDISAGSLPTDVIAQSYSNDNGYVYCSNFTVKAGGTVALPAGSISSTEVASDVARSGDTTAAPYIQTGTFTNGQGTITFDNPFKGGTIPIVICGWTIQDMSGASAITNAAWSSGVVASNQFSPKTLVAIGAELTNACYHAIGQLP